jgi:hypothetical protein
MQNLMGYAGLVGDNPYDPFPLGNQTKTGIPFSGGAGPGIGYLAGMPTQAWSGQPIQGSTGSTGSTSTGASTPGTTLYSNPINNTGGSAGGPNQLTAIAQMMGMTPDQLSNFTGPAAQKQVSDVLNTQMRNQQLQAQQTASDIKAASGGFGNMPNGAFNPTPNYIPQMTQPAQQQTAAAAAPATNASGLTRQEYLSRLANPGALPTYGASPPQTGQTATGTSPPNVVQAFLSSQGGKNTPFVNTLNQLQQRATG